MSKRRITAAVVAAVLTVIAASILIVYVSGADRRATQGLQPEAVLVVVQPVAKGTAADALGNAVQVKQVPQSAKAQGAVSSVAELGKRVASTDLVPGEQVLSARFVDPAKLQNAAVPAGMQEVSILLSSERTYGGRPAPGDTVGVFLSTKDQPKTTRLVLNGALVTRVQGGSQAQATAAAAGTAAAAQSTSAPEVNIMVTLALNTHDAERVVWAAENGNIWLSLQNSGTSTSGSSLVTPENANK